MSRTFVFVFLLLFYYSFGKINVKEYLDQGFTISVLPSNSPNDFFSNNKNIYAKISELEYNSENIVGDRYFGFIPVFKASLLPNNSVSSFSAPCFKEYSATISTFNETGATVTLKVSKKEFPICYDYFLFATQTTLRFHVIDKEGSYSLYFNWTNEYEKENIENNGFIIFYLPDGVIGSVLDVWETYLLMTSPEMVPDGLQFYKDHMNLTFTNRTVPGFQPDESEIMDGDYIGTLSFQIGLEGEGLSTLISWGTGSHTTHTAVCLRINGTLYVLESNSGGIQKTLYTDWMTYEDNVLKVLLRLRPDIREKFDSNAAASWFSKVDGLPYGYENFVYGWIDTLNDNYPPPTKNEDIPVLFVLGDYLSPTAMNLIFGKGLNQRLGTNGLSLVGILDYCDQNNISVTEVMTYPELDSFVYSDPEGPRMICDVFVLALYKAAGVFGDLQFQATELTPKDSYQLQIYDDNWQRPQGCDNDNNPPGICQFAGEYWLSLPGFNSISPYTNMNQKCGGVAPDYIRTPPFC